MKQRFDDDLQLVTTPLFLEALRLLLLMMRRRVLDDIMVTNAYLPTEKYESIIIVHLKDFAAAERRHFDFAGRAKKEERGEKNGRALFRCCRHKKMPLPLLSLSHRCDVACMLPMP